MFPLRGLTVSILSPTTASLMGLVVPSTRDTLSVPRRGEGGVRKGGGGKKGKGGRSKKGGVGRSKRGGLSEDGLSGAVY